MAYQILYNSFIPITFLVLGILIIISDFIHIKSNRKVVLKKRTKRKHSILAEIIHNKISIFFNNNKFFIRILDDLQFKIGFFSADSEKANRIRAEKMIIKFFLGNILIFICFLVLPINILVIPFLFAVIILFEYFIFNKKIERKQFLLKDQFHILIREFIEGYVIEKNIQKAFEYSVKGLNPVYQVHVNRLVNQLTSKTRAEEAFMNFNARIGYDMCSCFISVVQSGYVNNKNIVDNLIEVQELVNKDRLEEKKVRNKLSIFDKNNYLWIVVVIIELIGLGMATQSYNGSNFFFTDPIGQLLLIFSFIFIINSTVFMIVSDKI